MYYSMDMKIDTRDIVSVTAASQKGVSWLVNEAGAGRSKLILKNSEPAAFVTSVEDYERLEKIDELVDDLRLLMVATMRDLTSEGELHDLDDVPVELDIAL